MALARAAIALGAATDSSVGWTGIRCDTGFYAHGDDRMWQLADLRARKQEMARQGIIDAAFSLFSTHGFDGTTVEMIAERAVVSPRTVYRYFDSKESIVFAGDEGAPDEVVHAVRQHCADAVSVRALFDALADQLGDRQHDPSFRTLTALMRDNRPLMMRAREWRHTVVVRLAELLAELRGRPEPSLEDKALAGTVIAASAIAVAEWAARDHRDDLDELVLRAGRAIVDAREG